MTGELEGAVAEVARELGVKTGELYGYITGRGFESYARMMVVRNGMGSAFALAFAVALAILARRAYLRNDGKSGWEYSDEAEVFMIIFACASAIALVVFAIFVTECAQWAISPDGMAIDMVLGMVK